MSSRSLFHLLLVISLVGSAAAITAPEFWTRDPAVSIEMMKAGTYDPFREFNVFINGFFVPKQLSDIVYENCGPNLGYYVTSYMRDFIGGSLIYWIFAASWHYGIYVVWADELFIKRNREFPKPSWILDGMFTAQCAVTLYAALPVFAQFVIANKLTQTYFFVDEVGGYTNHFLLFALYFCCFEVGIYWAHRILHTNKWLYNNIHGPHHKYKTVDSLTPWTSIAFHPVDGIIQAWPYVFCLFLFPVHYITHVIMLFLSAVWATNIHDATWFDTEPMMGSKYHTLHHTHFVYNYGQYFTVCDYIWGTLRPPDYELLYPNDPSRQKTGATSSKDAEDDEPAPVKKTTSRAAAVRKQD